jgi:ubiquinone/menaquinone biosynthesis C-methylase UbiE
MDTAHAPIDGTSMTGELKSLSLFLVPLAVFAVYHSGAEFQVTFGADAEDYWEIFAVGISLIGVALRIAAFGLFHENGSSYAIRHNLGRRVRYPILLSDVLIVAGFILGTQVWWFGLVALAALIICYYGALTMAQDTELELVTDLADEHRGKTYVPLNDLIAIDRPQFSLLRGIWNAYPSLFLVVLFTTVMEVAHDLRVGDATLTHWPADWPFYFVALGLGCVGYAIATVEKRDAGVIHDAGPQTRGLRVDGRAGLVDTLENMISAGQQEDILTSTLAAAELSSGDVLLDIGCGSGKLVVAAARTHDGAAIGVDATPSMIVRARRRARREGVKADFREGVAENLPFADGSVHAVTSSYFFHHLPSDLKVKALREMWRILAPGGRLVITDYGSPRGVLGYVASLPMRFDFHEYVRPQLRGELERMLADEKLDNVERLESFLGYINVLRVRKPN